MLFATHTESAWLYRARRRLLAHEGRHLRHQPMLISFLRSTWSAFSKGIGVLRLMSEMSPERRRGEDVCDVVRGRRWLKRCPGVLISRPNHHGGFDGTGVHPRDVEIN